MKLPRIPALLPFILLISLVFMQTASAQTIVCMETVAGEICMELLESDAPATAQNFLDYVNQGSYRSSFFHASAKGGPAYIQAGAYADTGAGTLEGLQEIFRRPAIANESSISNTRGTVAMVPDDPNDPDSVTSQFLINVDDNSAFLDSETGGYTVFARIIGDGMQIVDLVASLPVVAFDNDDLSAVPILEQSIPVIDSPRIIFDEVSIFDGDINDFENSTGGDTGDGTGGDSGDGTGGDTGGNTPTPGEGQTLYEDAVCVDTNEGEFCMELLPDVAPNTVTNFLKYINDGDYDDTIIHRTEPNFIIQGGGYYSDPLGAEVPKDPAVINEFNRPNLRGTVAMAKFSGQVNSATSEWFVNLADNAFLDSDDGSGGGFFTVFAEIISGMDIVDKIGALQRIDLTSSLGSAFGEVPRVRTIGTGGVVPDDLVLVHRIYVTDVIVDENADTGDGSSDDEVETTTEFSTLTQRFVMPVWINDTLYRVTMNLVTGASGVVFRANTQNIYQLVDTGQDSATMDLDAGVLSIPSVKVGSKVITGVVFRLTDFSTLTFKLESYVLSE